MNTNSVRIHADLPAVSSAATPTGGWLDGVKRAFTALRRRHRRNRAIAELARMPDWRLEDMGIPRGRIVEVVEGLMAR
ncbi:MAG: DUF1127 domain-containing protein [Gammaproteobacteria bacterium]|nr:DUF1127 domain-containing protein [Gammaproteobacteria bacterium]